MALKKQEKPKAELVRVLPKGARKEIVAVNSKIQRPTGGERRAKGPIDVLYGVRRQGRVTQYGVSVGWDKNGFFVYTHRARSKSYPSQDKIPLSALKFIDSTG